MIILKKIRKVFLITLLALSTSVAFASVSEGVTQYESTHITEASIMGPGTIYGTFSAAAGIAGGGVFTSYTTFDNGPFITVMTITTILNDGTIYIDKEWWWN
jgi:hypothetical protein